MNEDAMYCVKCRVKRQAIEMQPITYKNKNRKGGVMSAISGKCAVCGTKMSRFLKSKT